MTHKRAVLFLSSCLAIVLFATRCSNDNNKGDTVKQDSITPVPLPSVVPGFHFPEDSNTVYSWLKPYDSVKVYQHAWGIWAGLTAPTSQVYQGDSLLVYQTWLGIGDIQTIIENGSGSSSAVKLSRTPLAVPNQHLDAKRIRSQMLGSGVDTNAGNNRLFWVAVSYDPASANYAISNSIFKDSVLEKYKVPGGIGNIPNFPQDAINIKPTYFVGHVTDSLIRVNAWPGPPDTPQTWAPQSWNSYVYVDVHNGQPAGKQLVPVTSSNPTAVQIAAATCNLTDFIYFKVDAAMARYLDKQEKPVQGDTARVGDLALLVAMHVTTKEINNWTWQSYYWDPNPDKPFSPSSPLAARLRPKELVGGAAHYSLTTCYVEVLPNQPLNGGTNSNVSPMIGYNPYLEAEFDPATFNFPNRMNKKFIYGVQTNCMSCHALATREPNPGLYCTDQYIPLNDPIFRDRIKLDFAWSIQSAIIK